MYNIELIKNRISAIDKEDYYSSSDLHVHTNYSDGESDFLAILEKAKNLNFKNLAISDHNTVQGYLDNEVSNYDFLIPAVEFDCLDGHLLVHILGYGVDPKNEELQAICAKDKTGCVHVLPRLMKAKSPKRVISAIHSAGGIAVLAHPCCMWVLSLDRYVKKLKKMGLDGIEVYYPYKKLRGIVKFHSSKIVSALAEKYDLIKTGGSDCHGMIGE